MVVVLEETHSKGISSSFFIKLIVLLLVFTEVWEW